MFIINSVIVHSACHNLTTLLLLVKLQWGCHGYHYVVELEVQSN